MSLLEPRAFYKPFQYPFAYDAWQMQQRIHWMPEEVSMADDVRDWKYSLSESERHLLTQIFRFFTQADIEVSNCYMQNYGKIFKPKEVQMMLAAFSNIETIHIAAYAHLLDTVGMPEVEYQAFLKYEQMKNKYDYLQQFNVDTKLDIAKTLAVFGAFTEGLQLFGSFAMLMNFQRFGKMKGMGQIVAWSVRDETLHTDSITHLFRIFINENPEVWSDELIAFLYNACRKIVELEDAFIDLAFEFGGAIEGITALDVKLYIRFIANRRLKQLGLSSIFDIKKNPLPWMDEILNSPEHANFFEARSTEYARAATKGNWDQAFEYHKNANT
ncbi:Ribonucleoside-diphosphate reductase subunit beta [Candidatus Cyrtobacter comes]|uniref:Ribonucleoside-diphosphate reductase subunit beta n=1 Tax=Candidatus Cyrtobacter comes TaxID=675776 RepID=A0ABU5L7U9_9RICK|nr:ribonucleotide-diphosphate reductase subunit beta [Candidatus Cyrtobacter comes]MDZ5761950.1 Ribonucleoside-diphosphate reductase subunit beta [Candidatus Cyrtobacter comes]